MTSRGPTRSSPRCSSPRATISRGRPWRSGRVISRALRRSGAKRPSRSRCSPTSPPPGAHGQGRRGGGAGVDGPGSYSPRRGAVRRRHRRHRQISRDSALFQEALYETAWILLRDESFDRAAGPGPALDLRSRFVHRLGDQAGEERSRFARDWGASRSSSRSEGVRRPARRLSTQLTARDDSREYFSAVVAEDMAHFRLDAVMPLEAVPVASESRGGPPRRSFDSSASSTELVETNALLVRMEQAVRAPERARLFQDLGGCRVARRGRHGRSASRSCW